MNDIVLKSRARLRRWVINNQRIGWILEHVGNCALLDGNRISLDCPLLSRGHKSTIAFGYHEMPERKLVKNYLPRTLPVVELGGGLGVVSCLTNRMLSDPSKHVVLEANPAMLPVLERNRAMNNCKFEIVHKAIAYGSSEVSITLDGEFVGSKVGEGAVGNESVVVPATTLSRICERFEGDEFALVSDVEGMECEIVENEAELLRESCRVIVMETHERYVGAAKHAAMLASLKKIGFTIRDEEANVFAFERKL